MSKTFILIIAIIVIVGGIFWWQRDNISNLFFDESPKACTQEAKLCSDGSYVGRTGPNCEFAACPEDATADWQTYRNEEYGFEIKYPKEASVVLSPKGGGIVYVGTTNSGDNVYNYGIIFNSLGSTNNKSAENWYSQYYQNEKQEAMKLDLPFHLSASGQNVQLNSYVVAYETTVIQADSAIVNFYIVHNGNIYKLSYVHESANDPKWNEHEEITNQILSTFKFIE